MSGNYDHRFYADRHSRTVYAANAILPLVLDALPRVDSAADFGCGVGTWLSVLKQHGVSEIRGLDGPWVERDLLEIPREDFQEVNLEETIRLERRYDLAITLEVAEHISEQSANSFIDSLVRASDFILFSAAIPFQGGNGHVNEQWPDYWAKMFAARGYRVIDFVRKKIWNDENISVWYRQNILLFANEKRIATVDPKLLINVEDSGPLAIVHPEMYHAKLKQRSVKGRVAWFRQGVKSRIMKILNNRR